MTADFNKLQIVEYRPEFTERILEVQKHLWAQDVEVGLSYLKWKYQRNPYIDTPLIFSVLDADQVVGMIGAYGSKWELGDLEPFRCLCLGDLVLKPEYRKQGIFSRLIKSVVNALYQSHTDYAFDLSAPFDVGIAMLMQGWRALSMETAYRKSNRAGGPAKVDRYSRLPVSPRGLRQSARSLHLLRAAYHQIQSYLRKPAIPDSADWPSPFETLDRKALNRKAKIDPHIWMAKTARPAEMAGLVARLGFDGRLRHVRDEQYFTWRFQNPLADYRFLYWDADSRMEGYLVLQARLHCPYKGVRLTINLVDWEASNPEIFTRLLNMAVKASDFPQLDTWSGTLSVEAKSILKSQGFQLAETKGSITRNNHLPLILLNRLDQKAGQTNWTLANVNLLDLSNWDLRMIYSDSY